MPVLYSRAPPKSGAGAAALLGAAEALREEIGSPLQLSEQESYGCVVAEIRVALDETVFAAAWAVGRTLPLDQAIALALRDESLT